MPTADEIRHEVYRRTAATGRPPRAAELAKALGVDRTEVLDAFRRLRELKLLYLAAESGEIAMAPPFSAVPTPFAVRAADRTYFANCVWDAYGVAAALNADADIEASCACCGEPLSLAVRDGLPVEPEGGAVAHFAVPAAQWWEDLTYT
jgi:hypothetical protein